MHVVIFLSVLTWTAQRLTSVNSVIYQSDVEILYLLFSLHGLYPLKQIKYFIQFSLLISKIAE